MKNHQIFQPSLLERKPIVLKVNKKLIVLVFKYLTFNKTIFRSVSSFLNSSLIDRILERKKETIRIKPKNYENFFIAIKKTSIN